MPGKSLLGNVCEKLAAAKTKTTANDAAKGVSNFLIIIFLLVTEYTSRGRVTRSFFLKFLELVGSYFAVAINCIRLVLEYSAGCLVANYLIVFLTIFFMVFCEIGPKKCGFYT